MFYFDFVSEDAKDLIEKLLLVDPTERLSAKDILKHKWFQGDEETDCLQHLLHAQWEYLPKRPKVGEYSHDEQLSYQQSQDHRFFGFLSIEPENERREDLKRKREGNEEELREREKV